MGTALLALSSLFAPIQSWVARHADARRSSGLNATELHYVNVRPRPGGEMRHAASSRRDAAERPPLRVVRVVESGEPRSHGSRLVIAGRMADVCAELDRLVEKELREAGRPSGSTLH
ncbi:hypothetical protein [Pseudacidovorax sp. NFM-22]|uniref:hypothetical protein n=1 Tax=Pseudacidovorax sp. NFM-22 TaxID=2744469 RepID=UPI001F3EDADF|nr:hypothetical protein [Pseudacidovorax sp. NFM-22]